VRGLEPEHRAHPVLRDDAMSTAEAVAIVQAEQPSTPRLQRAHLAVPAAVDGYLPEDES